ncbi:MAG: glutamate synthase large subunit [Bacteroidales bacterium]
MEEFQKKSLYDQSYEHDACGIGFLANLKGKKSYKIIDDALKMLENMEHRGAVGFEENTGDGAGILIQIPHDFFTEECDKIGLTLPEYGKYGVGMIYFPAEVKMREACRKIFNDTLEHLGLELLGYRNVPVNRKGIGKTALSTEPKIEQAFIIAKDSSITGEDLERKLFVLRNWSFNLFKKTFPRHAEDFYIPTLSYKTIAYKGQLTTYQVRSYYLDLQNPKMISGLAMVHSRFSTNTFPKWKLAQPFRYIAHNGEINTIKGNVNTVVSNETLFESSLFSKKDIEKLRPICDHENSDSANLDNMIEMLVLSGRELPHVMMMLMPEAWQNDTEMQDPKKAFYEYHANIVEPWDGPASVSFTDGHIIGATLDRNGLRPSRYSLLEDGTLIMASETGALKIDQSKVVQKGRLEPGKMFIADLNEGRIISDEEIKQRICSEQPYRTWIEQNKVHINDIPEPKKPTYTYNADTLTQRQIAYGYTQETVKSIIAEMVNKSADPIGSMGNDAPLAVLSRQARHISNYFKQQFAQVSNPPIDPIREKIIMSLKTSVSRSFNMLSITSLHAKHIAFDQPVLTNEQIDAIRYITHPDFRVTQLDATFKAINEPNSLEDSLKRMCADADSAIIDKTTNILIISDRNTSKDRAAIPTLLAIGALHNHLVNNGLRARVGIIIEAGDVVETHHYATIIGYGANAVNPYMAFETITSLQRGKYIKNKTTEEANEAYINAIGAGLLKIFSKMGISTLQSYRGAQIFECYGLGENIINLCFKGTVSKIGGMDFKDIAKETLVKHFAAYPEKPIVNQRLEEGGIHQWKHRGEKHLFNPQTISLLQQAVRTDDYELYKQYAQLINEQHDQQFTLRSLLDFKGNRKAISIDEVEPAENIYKRFATGAMSFGSISYEAHSTLAIAMNKLGGKSNSGEGGEDEIRFVQKENGDWERSAIKQVASGRFGVTSHYLANCNEIQIKMAQGAKPGEGGQLPGHKVDEWIGRVRHSTPGVGLISPPPHHDIYSIEDLAQLIFDLKNANPDAHINVKLVSKAGVGTIAAGVAKAFADKVLISGHDGGTGASPVSSIHHCGSPWEMGLAETHQTLVINKLRDRIIVQSDGQMKSGRDLAIATLLGAEEWGVATAALVAEGCIMMRKCHLNTCPVGVATQNKDLRKVFKGKPEHVMNLFKFMTQELREIMAANGFKSINEMVGQSNILRQRDDLAYWKVQKLNLDPIIYQVPSDPDIKTYHSKDQKHAIHSILDRKLIEKALPAIKNGSKVTEEFDIINTDRAVGTMLSHEISKKYGNNGLPENTINYTFTGSAGQSFAAFGQSGLTFRVFGDANDYFGKGLSGAKLIIRPNQKSNFAPEKNVLIGNVAFYGATSGEAYIRGVAGERFCIRNSGVQTVVEGIGNHGCEYMTGGTVVVLGKFGMNFAAGMSGGIAYIYDPEHIFDLYCNKASVDLEKVPFEDVNLLKTLITNHQKYTDSTVASQVLENWDDALESFVKVYPRDFKRVIEERKKMEAAAAE